MKHFQYLVIGGGLTGDAAVRGIRELDAEGSIGMISTEPDPPYMRPNLSKGLWKGRPIEKIWRNTQDLGAELHLGRKVTYLDPQNKIVRDEKGDEYTYIKLLLATGGSPIRLPFGEDHIIYYRDLQDYQRLRALSEQRDRFLVIGGGFIGSEIAAALTMVGKKVTMVFLEGAIGANIYPKDLSGFLNDYYRQKGVEVVPGDSVASLEKTGDRFTVRTKGGSAFEVDGVVGGIGIRPNIELARQAGLQVENGVVVDPASYGPLLRIFMLPATWRTFSIRRWVSAYGWSMKITPSRWGNRRGEIWQARTRPIRMCPCSTQIYLSWVMRPSAN